MSPNTEIHDIPDAAYRMPALYSFFALFVGAAVAAILLKIIPRGHGMLRLLAALFPIQICCLATILLSLFSLSRRHGIRQTFNIPRDMPPALACIKHIVITLLVLYPTIALVTLAAEWLCIKTGLPIVEQTFAKLPPDASPLHIALLAIACVVIAPVTEELLMRLVLFRAIRSRWPNAAFFLTASIFAVFHGCPQYAPGLFLVGIALQMTQKKGGMPLAIALHSAFNAISLLMLN